MAYSCALFFCSSVIKEVGYLLKKDAFLERGLLELSNLIRSLLKFTLCCFSSPISLRWALLFNLADRAIIHASGQSE